MVKIKRYKEHNEGFKDIFTRIGEETGELANQAKKSFNDWWYGKPVDLKARTKEEDQKLGEEILMRIKGMSETYDTNINQLATPEFMRIYMRAENDYFFFTQFNGKTYRIDIIKDLDDYFVYIIENKDRNVDKVKGISVRTTSSGRHAKNDWGIPFTGQLSKGVTKRNEQNKLLIDDVWTKDDKNYKKRLSQRIFEEAALKYERVNRTSKKNAL